MNMGNNTFILRLTMAIVLLTHSIPGMLDGGVNAFGEMFLNQIGFAPFGVPIAWAVKISHVVCAVLFLMDKYIKPASYVTILILIMGIILVHFKEGWFVVGGGRNGIEYNFVLICILIAIMFPNGLKTTTSKT
jgi:putative oxidoreductase